jgi:hypothetical protein
MTSSLVGSSVGALCVADAVGVGSGGGGVVGADVAVGAPLGLPAVMRGVASAGVLAGGSVAPCRLVMSMHPVAARAAATKKAARLLLTTDAPRSGRAGRLPPRSSKALRRPSRLA